MHEAPGWYFLFAIFSLFDWIILKFQQVILPVWLCMLEDVISGSGMMMPPHNF